MSIQLPVVIWTIINFALLCVILEFLLFKPMYAFMHARKEKLESARAKRAEAEKEFDARAEQRNATAKAMAMKLANDRDKAIEYARTKALERMAQAVDEAAADREKGIQLNEEAIHASREQLDGAIDTLARAFADRLVG